MVIAHGRIHKKSPTKTNKSQVTLRILGMSWGVKNTFFEASGVSLGGSGVSIGGVKIFRAGTIRPHITAQPHHNLRLHPRCDMNHGCVGCFRISYRSYKKSGDHQLRLVVYPIIYRVLYIPGGAGFFPIYGGFRSHFWLPRKLPPCSTRMVNLGICLLPLQL